ncbi:MAG: sulfur carrier protein ThiS [Pseudohongiellaceae bacterium]
MQVRVNGDPQTIHDNATLGELLEQLSLTGGRIAVEINRDIIPRSEHGRHRLQDGDHIEVVQAIGGG